MPKNLARSIAALALATLTAPALAQQPTDEQISAIRASCRSDFMAHCAGVPRGGAEALRCLKQNLAQLSPACQTAVSAVGPKSPPAAPAAASAPPPPAPTTAAPATPAPSAPAATATPPAAPPAATPAPNSVAKPTKPARTAPAAAAVAPAGQPPAAQPAPLGPIPPLRPRARLAILRACAAEHQALCADVPPGGGRIVECLAANGAALSPGCRGAILSAR